MKRVKAEKNKDALMLHLKSVKDTENLAALITTF